jgi:hypothetical protein
VSSKEDQQRLARIADRVLALTQNGELKWAAVEESKTLFASKWGERIITIRSEDKDDVAPFRLAFTNEKNVEVAHVKSIMGATRPNDQALNTTLGTIYRTARRQALGIDKALDDLERDLGLWP